MTTSKAAKLSIDQLQPGMYICDLDRPWLETPFLMQGFYIESAEDIDELNKFCLYAYIDPTKSRTGYDIRFQEHVDKKHNQRIKQLFPQHSLLVYRDTTRWQDELTHAKPIIEHLTKDISQLMDSIKSYSLLDASKIKQSIEPMVESVIRNPDACIWLARMKNKDSYTYKHSMSASIWAVALGRQIGLPINDLKDLAVGALLFDIGKLKIPENILNKTSRLDNREFELIKTHVNLAVDLLEKHGGFNKTVIEMVANHHERFNGKGYPNQIKGTDIPIFARIAAIVDCYDAITSERPYAQALSPSAAVRKLYEWRSIDFQAELIEEFIQSIGIYPAGTLVELSSGEVGAVLAEYRSRRLRPQVLLLLNRNKEPLKELKTINLLEIAEDSEGNPLEIMRSLEPGAYGIDPESLYL